MHYHHLTITYNGELYNYIELKEELLKRGFNFTTDTDTEIILAAYLHYGKNCLQYFDGMFSFMIYDDKNKEFFGARDRFGEKPFYYYQDKYQFIFGSEMKAIFTAGIPQQVSDKMLYYYLTYDVVENPLEKEETFYKNIFQVPASHSISIQLNGDVKTEKYWKIELTTKTNLSYADAVEQFQFLFDDSVKKRLRSDVKVGASFSGGIDSSSVVASILSQNNEVELNTFTARFKNKKYDEGEFLDIMEQAFSFKPNYCWPHENLIINELDKIFYHQEEPFISTSILAQWEVMKKAKTNGTKVLLDGQGADETLAGYYKYFIPFLSELYKTNKTNFNTQLKAVETNLEWENVLPKQFYLNSLLPKTVGFIADLVRPLKLGYLSPDLSPDFIQTFKKEPSPFIRTNSLNEFLHFDTFNYGLGKLLRFSDRNAMAHSREVRLPYLSHELAEFLFSLPSNFKMKDGWSKMILRESMKNRLPKKIAWRKDKKGFQAPNNWLDQPKVKGLVVESVSRLKTEGYLRAPNEQNNWKYIMAAKLLSFN
jgi:asparagine synthase (glutamine-hydrolysing)